MFALELTLAPFTVAALSGVVIPVLIALVTKATAPDKVKGSLLLVLSAVAGVIAQNVDSAGGAVFSQATIQSAALALATSLAMYLGFYKTVGLNDVVAPKFGIGAPPAPPADEPAFRAFPHD